MRMRRVLIIRRIRPDTKKMVSIEAMLTTKEVKALVRWTCGEGTLEELLPNQPEEIKDFLKRNS